MPYTVKKIDIHVHSMENYGMSYYRSNGETYATPAEIRKMYDDMGIDWGILLPELNPEGMHRTISNEEAKRMADAHPETFKWFMNIDPRMGNNSPKYDFTPMIEFYKSHGALGIGEICANLAFDDPLMENLIFHADACGMPFDIHMSSVKKQYGDYGIRDDFRLPLLEKTLKKYHNIKILGHSQMFWAHMSGDLTEEKMGGYPTGKVTSDGRIAELMREYPNLYGDMSAGSGGNAFMRDPDYAYRFIEEFADRLLFGTDICQPHNFFPLSGWLDESVMNGSISQENYIKICRGNALKLLGL